MSDMDLLRCFQDTLCNDLNKLHEAELRLHHLALVPGFYSGCLDMLQADHLQDIKVAAAVFFKNQILKNWQPPDASFDLQSVQHPIIDEEKAHIKSNLLAIFDQSNYHIKQQLIPVLRLLITIEYPNQWPELLAQVGPYLDTNPKSMADEEFNEIYTAIVAITEIFRKYRWFNNNQRELILEPILDQISPFLVTLCDYLAHNSEQLTEFKAEIMKLILKGFKYLTYFDMPLYLQTPVMMQRWHHIYIKIVNMKLPGYIKGSEYDKEMLQISKVLKWSFANLNRLLERYVLGRSVHIQFKKMFVTDILPGITQNLIEIVELWCMKQKWLNLSSLYYLLEVLSNCVSIKSLWKLIKPITSHLIRYVIYPILVPNDRKIEIFQNDPQEYIQLTFNYFNTEKNIPDMAAIALLNTLLEKRTATCVAPVASFISNKLEELGKCPETMPVAQQKEGILRMMGAMIRHLFDKNEYDVEGFLMTKVLNNLNSSHEFLVARTFEVIGKFSDLKFTDEENLNLVIYSILRNFQTSENVNLVVMLENSLAIQSYLHIPEFKQQLSTMVLGVMSKLLDFSSQVDNDIISVVMQECVENFSEQLQPFGAELVEQLVANFMDLCQDLDDDNSDKVISAIGILNTIITVLLSFQNNQAVVHRLIEVLLPVIKHVLGLGDENFVTEIAEIIENLVFLNRDITPDLYDILHVIAALFNTKLGLAYFDELLPCLKNFLIYGETFAGYIANPNTIASNNDLRDAYANIFVQIFTTVSNDEACDNQQDWISNLELIQYFILAYKLYLVPYLPVIVPEIIKLLPQYNTNDIAFKINVINTLISCLIYDSNLTIRLLHQNFNHFLIHWMNSVPSLSRVYDIKLSVLGMISLANNNNIVVNNLEMNLSYLMKKLPHQIVELNKRKQVFDAINHKNDALCGPEIDLDVDDVDDDNDDDNISNSVHNPVKNDEAVSQTEYIQFLNQENLKLLNVEEIVEDPLEVTPLDNVDVYDIFSNFMELLKVKNIEKYNILFGDVQCP